MRLEVNDKEITEKISSTKIWKKCLSVIKENVPALTYSTWFTPIKPIEYNNNRLKIEVPNTFFIEWIEEHYNTIINNVVNQILGKEGKLLYVVLDEDVANLEMTNIIDAPQTREVITPIVDEVRPEFESYLMPRYKFDNFIKGEGNQLARAAAIAIGENSGETSFNPFFIYGGVGLGKTHLMQAIGNRIIEKSPSKKVIYISTEQFTVEFIDAIQSGKANEFSNFYKSMDALIIDDIQFLIGKERTQDYFFHIFNRLHQAGKQIILSSDKPPKELKGLNERLISRFQWGLTADIQAPDFETRMAILKNKAESFGISIPNDILEYMAHNITSNIRELEGCLIKILASASLNSQEIDLTLAKKAVNEIATGRQINISIDYITQIVCEYFEVDENKVREKNRKKEVVLARQVAMFLSKKLTKSSLKTIGLHFGGRDHSTVIHAYNSVEKLLSDDKTKGIVESLRNRIELGVS
ncbi:MAG: chromosomal replication initiator protein DnaA [Melioribacteraceae bacterium]|nr:chromosomal replication initiator protein DnaA [Melioribacteraceae bacterium]